LGQRLDAVLFDIEFEGIGALVSDRASERGEMLHHAFTESEHLACDESSPSQQQSHRAGQHDDQRLLVADGEILERFHLSSAEQQPVFSCFGAARFAGDWEIRSASSAPAEVLFQTMPTMKLH
jgi:hypothetical protein